MNILHIDSSILGEQSATRVLSAAVVRRFVEGDPGAVVTYRDLARNSLPQFSAANLDPQYVNDALGELLAADVIVVGAPMYNFSVPSQLKSWLDAVSIPGKTFAYDASGVKGLLGAKRVVIASARGGFYGAETPMAALDHQESYLRALFGFLGVTRLEIVRAEGLKVSEEMKNQGIAAGLRQAGELAIV